MGKTAVAKATPAPKENARRRAGRPAGKVGKSKTPKCTPGNYFLTAADMAAVKEELYAKCSKKRQTLFWARCSKFILDPLIERILKLANVTSDDTFLDIGSGIGNVVQTVATRVGCDCIGVELTKANHDVAVESNPLFDKYRQENQLPMPSIEFVRSDLRKVVDNYTDRVSVVWVANLLMPLEVNCFLINYFVSLRPGTRIFVMTNLIPHDTTKPILGNGKETLLDYFTFTDFSWGAGEVEWTNQPGPLYMYTRTNVMPDDE